MWKRICILSCHETVVKKQQAEWFFLSPLTSNGSIRCCPPTPRPSTQAAHQLLHTVCPESSCSCFSRLVGSLGFILALGTSASNGSPSSSFPFGHLHVTLQLVHCLHLIGATSVFRVSVGLTSAHCCAILVSRLLRSVHNIWFLLISLLCSGRN